LMVSWDSWSFFSVSNRVLFSEEILQLSNLLRIRRWLATFWESRPCVRFASSSFFWAAVSFGGSRGAGAGAGLGPGKVEMVRCEREQ
jgi:hypothetical protein